MATFEQHLNEVLSVLPKTPAELHELVGETLNKASNLGTLESQRGQWEYLLRKSIFELAATEEAALKTGDTKYYDQLRDRLDLVLAFADHEAVTSNIPLLVIEDLLDTQTISSCVHIFSYLQSRSPKLTKGLVPNKGPALTLLRSLNDLLRRLSKTGQTRSSGSKDGSSSLHGEINDGAAFCGRILCFLSDVFHLTERSGVNLRGEYGPPWDGPGAEIFDPEVAKRQANSEESQAQGTVDEEQMDTEGEKPASQEDKKDKKDDLYKTFWSLQSLFARPSLFSQSQPIGQPSTVQKFKKAVEKVLPVLKEANARDRAVLGSRTSSTSKNGVSTAPSPTLKRKRGASEDLETGPSEKGEEYFFTKFLTSPDLLDLELADPLFRRQFLTQLLILCTHLLTFTKAAKVVWATGRNRSVQMDFTLDPDDEWMCISTISDCYIELKATYPSGSTYAESVRVILEREKNWIKWKNELCPDFRKIPSYFELEDSDNSSPEKKRVTMEEATKKFRATPRELEPWPHKYGTEPISEVWIMGYRSTADLESSFSPGDPQSFLRQIKLEDMKIQKQQKRLDEIAATRRAREAELRKKREEEEAKAKESQMDVDEKSDPPPTTTEEMPTSSQPITPAPVAKESTATANVPAAPSPAPVAAPTPLPSLHPSLPQKPGLSVSAPEFKPKSTTPQPAVEPPKKEKPPPPKAAPVDPIIARATETKDRITWLALRAARDTHLKYFATNGTGDIERLVKDANDPNWTPNKKEDSKETVDNGGKAAPPPTKEKPSEPAKTEEDPVEPKKEEGSAGPKNDDKEESKDDIVMGGPSTVETKEPPSTQKPAEAGYTKDEDGWFHAKPDETGEPAKMEVDSAS